jgi:spore coat protein CotH
MCSTAWAQSSFYDNDSIREIRLYFYAQNWDHLLDSFYVDGEEERILADLMVDSVYYDSVGVRYKGFSSVSVNRLKNPFNIKLDYVIDDQNHQGFDKLKLSNVIQDPSFMREVLSYHVAADYMPCSRANFANLYINDTLWGLYTNVEAVNKSFLNDHFDSKYGAFFKCNPENLDVSPGGENANLSNTHGTDSLDYEPFYDLKSDHGWSDLYALIDTLNNHVDSIENILNVDRALWMHAFNYVLVNFDSYVGYGQNYYLYRDETGQFNPILWDLNMSFGSFRLTDASSLYYNGFSILEAQNMDPLVHHDAISIAPRPQMRNLFQEERRRKMYLAHIRTIVNEHFANQAYANKAANLQALIDTSVQNDTNKFYTYADFLDNQTMSVSLVTGDCPGITELMDDRVAYLNTYTGFSGEPNITNITNGPHLLGNDLWITANINDATAAIIRYRFGKNSRFEEVEMYDDGLHNDGAANDGVYGGIIPNASNQIDYYLYADNDSAGTFSPARAAYEYYSLQTTFQGGGLVINELMANNLSTAADGSGDYEDWIELHNTSNTTISTEGLYLSDTLGILHKWAMPSYSIPPQGYLIVWADEDGGQGALHANFKLSNLGETLYLTNADSLLIDSVSYVPQAVNQAFARVPNGTGPFVLKDPSFKRNNEEVLTVQEPQLTNVVFPNPFSEQLFLEKQDDVQVWDMLGKLVYQAKAVSYVQTAAWEAGLYVVYTKSDKQYRKLIKIN